MSIKRLAALTILLALPAAPALAGDAHGWRGKPHGYRVMRVEERGHGYRRVYRRGPRFVHGGHPVRRPIRRHYRHHRHYHRHHGSRVVVRKTVIVRPAPVYRETVVVGAVPAYAAPPAAYAGPNCGTGAAGTVLGGLTGAAIGSGFGKGRGHGAAVLTGAVLGAVIGGSIGNDMDRVDPRCNGSLAAVPARAEAVPPMPAIPPVPVETQPLGNDPSQAAVPAPQPLPSGETNGRYCREYQSTATINGQPQPVYGTACRKPDGSWEIVS